MDTLSSEELECKICYCLYNLGSRRPKVLECCHPLCSKCLVKLQDLESPPSAVVCPFCRYVTRFPSQMTANCWQFWLLEAGTRGTSACTQRRAQSWFSAPDV